MLTLGVHKVLYGHQYDCSTYSLYVTDYTSNPQTSPVQAKWCHPGLADRVLRIEMWPPANELAKTMLAGEYWSICNNRMKIDRAGFLEGTFSASHKARKLDESEAEFFPHLKGLLQCVWTALQIPISNASPQTEEGLGELFCPDLSSIQASPF